MPIGEFTELIPGDFRYTSYSNACVYLEGIKTVKSYSSEKVNFGTKKGIITINGKGLCIEKFLSGDAVVRGKISSVEVFDLK
ncbi:MAG: YabP/YqfC family sporulation protein [Christensenellaceae bacterium]|nr:YabP/YqfC family sporulation protein [Christensenellaceae bacterium]MDD6926672.1 YabP/YqfC family sporulation protein [bacterium]MDY2850983.1 YabP/YqfC family sporulation protein [Christensenellaceae bacterium]